MFDLQIITNYSLRGDFANLKIYGHSFPEIAHKDLVSVCTHIKSSMKWTSYRIKVVAASV